MPYIKQELRDKLDDRCQGIIDEIMMILQREEAEEKDTMGMLNYCFSSVIDRLLIEYFQVGYFEINQITGMLENVKLEFQRKIVAPYEDAKEADNGPVYSETDNGPVYSETDLPF